MRIRAAGLQISSACVAHGAIRKGSGPRAPNGFLELKYTGTRLGAKPVPMALGSIHRLLSHADLAPERDGKLSSVAVAN